MIVSVISEIDSLDDRAFMTRLYEDYWRLMFSTAGKCCGQWADREDMVQESLLRLIAHVKTLRTMERAVLASYIVITVRNTCYDYLLKFVPAEDLTEYEAIQSDPLDMVWDTFSVNEIKKKLMIFVEGLSERNRNLFIDAVVLGYHYKELSKKYGLTETNISVKIFRFRVRLRKLLEQED